MHLWYDLARPLPIPTRFESILRRAQENLLKAIPLRSVWELWELWDHWRRWELCLAD